MMADQKKNRRIAEYLQCDRGLVDQGLKRQSGEILLEMEAISLGIDHG
ncbi:MAG: hypothetical protein V3R94_00625 [Acidobacteriota bacterium]